MYLEILQNSQENSCARVSFLIKLQAKAYNFIKKETGVQVFSEENTFLQNTSGRLLQPFDIRKTRIGCGMELNSFKFR